MAKFTVVATITISVHTDVEAETLKEAFEEAKKRGMISLCHQCARGEDDREWVTSGELDGLPDELLGVSKDGKDVKITKRVQAQWSKA